MFFQSESSWTGLQLVGGFVIALLTAVGGGQLALAIFNRWGKRKDRNSELHQTNQGKAIDADADAFKMLAERLKIVETRLDKLQSEHNSQMKEYGKVIAENEWLKKDNLRQEGEIVELRAESRQRGERIMQLESQSAEQALQIKQLIAKVEALSK